MCVYKKFSGGCKQYGLELRNRKNADDVSHVLKVRGLTLDSTNEDKFNFNSFLVRLSLLLCGGGKLFVLS